MSKRPISLADDSGGSSSHNGKRQQTHSSASLRTSALLELIDHADEFIGCLKLLKENRQHTQSQDGETSRPSHVEQSLFELSRKLLPSFQILGSDEEHGLFGHGPAANDPPDVLKAPQTPVAAEGSHVDLAVASPGIPVPTFFTITPWVASEIASGLPPLPKISRPELAKAAFRHRGLGSGMNYERLEWLGDAYVELIASSLIFQTFGQSQAGRCSQLREQLVRNATLAGYFQQYNMQSQAQLPPEFGATGREVGLLKAKDKELQKTQGDMLEAYVAAVIISDPREGVARAAAWLKALWGRTLKDQIVQAEKKGDTLNAPELKSELPPPSKSVSAKERLAQAISVKGILIRYEDMPGNKRDSKMGLPLFTVGVYLDGWGAKHQLLGTGTAMRKMEAGQKAAAVALENKKLMKVYEGKKKAFLEARDTAVGGA